MWDYWRVDLKKIGDSYFLNKGWKDFAEANHLNFGDFLTFNFDGTSAFHVKIYGYDACEKRVGKRVRKRGRPVTRRCVNMSPPRRTNYKDKAAVDSLGKTESVRIKTEDDDLSPPPQPQSQSKPPQKRKRSCGNENLGGMKLAL